jgi:hypothetical protein
MPTPISTNVVPITPSAARGRTRRRCGNIERVSGLDAICWRTAPPLGKSKRAMADLRKISTPYRTAMPNKISRRNPPSQNKGCIKSPRGIACGTSWLRAPPKGSSSGLLLIGRGRNPPRLFMPTCPNAARTRLAAYKRAGFACVTVSRLTFMAIALLKSFDRGDGVAILKLDGSRSEFAAHVAGSDRTAMSSVVPGQRIRCDVRRDRRGRTFAVDVRPIGGIAG